MVATAGAHPVPDSRSDRGRHRWGRPCAARSHALAPGLAPCVSRRDRPCRPGRRRALGRRRPEARRRRPSMSWRRGSGARWARVLCSRREAVTPCAWRRVTWTSSGSKGSSGAGGQSSRAASRGRRRRPCDRRSRSGAARRWRTSARSASPSRRSRGSRTCGSPAWAIAWTRIWPVAATLSLLASWKRSCSNIRCASGSVASRCSPSTAPGVRPMPSTHTAAPTPRSSTASASSRRRSCGRWRRRSCAKTFRRRHRRRNHPSIGRPSLSTTRGAA